PGPLPGPNHSTARAFSGSMACVTTTRLPHTIGVELPRSDNGVRHSTFSLVPQRCGRCFSLATPVPAGPRQVGQFSATAETAAHSKPAASIVCQWTCDAFINSCYLLIGPM